MKNYDVVIIGAGSVGLPLAHRLAVKGVSVAVVDRLASAGQGQNKAAIGGIRATHSDRAKIKIGLLSLDFIRRLEPEYGEDVDYIEGGYLFPVLRPDCPESPVTPAHSKELWSEYRLDWAGRGAGNSPRHSLPGTFRRNLLPRRWPPLPAQAGRCLLPPGEKGWGGVPFRNGSDRL